MLSKFATCALTISHNRVIGRLENMAPKQKHKYTSKDTLLYLAFILSLLPIFIASTILSPDENGLGTHTQLGMPACIFHRLTLLPCPNCGMTTSFAHMAKFRFREGFKVQPFGGGLFILLALSCASSVLLSIAKVPVIHIFRHRYFDHLCIVLVVLYVVSWMFKIATVAIAR